jgi:formate dehydrogenase (coenzyme F420) beta subunit
VPEVQDALVARIRSLLESGTVATVIGWEAGRFTHQTTPCIITDASQADRLIYNDYCVNTLAKYVLDRKSAGRVALMTRGCESRAVNRMIEDGQLSRDDVYLLGVSCAGMKDRETEETLTKCRTCRHHGPVVFDEMLIEGPVHISAEERFAEVEELEKLPREERAAYFDSLFTKCIRCYACRDVCPCCTCRTCFVDARQTGWQGKQNNLAENRFYGLTRAFHISDRCIECGECERVCPMELPLMQLNRKLIKDMNDLFGTFESGMDTEQVDVLRNYRLDDIEEFM